MVIDIQVFRVINGNLPEILYALYYIKENVVDVKINWKFTDIICRMENQEYVMSLLILKKLTSKVNLLVLEVWSKDCHLIKAAQKMKYLASQIKEE